MQFRGGRRRPQAVPSARGHRLMSPWSVPPWALSAWPGRSPPPLGDRWFVSLAGLVGLPWGEQLWPSRLDRGLPEGLEREGVRTRKLRGESQAARATSGDVITGTNSSLAQRRFPAAGRAPMGSGAPQGEPRSRNSPQRLHQLGEDALRAWPAQKRQIPSRRQLPRLAPQGMGKISVPLSSAGSWGGPGVPLTLVPSCSLHLCEAAGGPPPSPAP